MKSRPLAFVPPTNLCRALLCTIDALDADDFDVANHQPAPRICSALLAQQD